MQEQRLELNTKNIFDHLRKRGLQSQRQRWVHVCRFCRFGFFSPSLSCRLLKSTHSTSSTFCIESTYEYNGQINRKTGTECAFIRCGLMRYCSLDWMNALDFRWINSEESLNISCESFISYSLVRISFPSKSMFFFFTSRSSTRVHNTINKTIKTKLVAFRLFTIMTF